MRDTTDQKHVKAFSVLRSALDFSPSEHRFEPSPRETRGKGPQGCVLTDGKSCRGLNDVVGCRSDSALGPFTRFRSFEIAYGMTLIVERLISECLSAGSNLDSERLEKGTLKVLFGGWEVMPWSQ